MSEHAASDGRLSLRLAKEQRRGHDPGSVPQIVRSSCLVRPDRGFRNACASSGLDDASDPSAPLAQMQERRRDCCRSINPAVLVDALWCA
jgi:hypothetical protein